MTTTTAQKYEIVIGLEVHAQLRTDSKLFCSCSTKFGAAPNAHTCPVCMGYPGVLPVLNQKAVDFAIQAGLALDCTINLDSKFDRKHYFYPDLPKGYQVSQYDRPLCEHGKLSISNKDVNIVRIHMEEDAGKLVHAGAERLHGSDYSLVDLNRAGTPLIEIVSAPDINSADEAVEYVRELRKILLYLGVCDGNMQEGSMRCDVNISINKPGEGYGTRAEIKNVNSFRSIARAIEYEYKRQEEILDKGGKVVQETRLFEEASGKTHSMRSKEDAQDYRYFPEPDLLPLIVPQEQVDSSRAGLPELPQQKQARYTQEFGLNHEAALILTEDYESTIFFEKVVASGANASKAANWLNGSVTAYLNENKLTLEQTKLSPELLAEMIKLIEEGVISDNIAKNDIIGELLVSGISVKKLIEDKGLAQITDTSAIKEIVQAVINENPKQLEQFKAGNPKVKGFFVGQVMKRTEGKASPQIINQLVDELLV